MSDTNKVSSPTGQADFLSAYRSALISHYVWARTGTKIDTFLESCKATLDGANTWSHIGEAVVSAWYAIGGKMKQPSLKALRALGR